MEQNETKLKGAKLNKVPFNVSAKHHEERQTEPCENGRKITKVFYLNSQDWMSLKSELI